MDILISANDTVLNLIKNLSTDEIEKIDFDSFSNYNELEGLEEENDKNNKKYKCSIYNYYVGDGEEYLIYNTLYNSLVRVNNIEYQELSEVLDCSNLKSSFLKNGLWIEEAIDERERYIAIADAFTNKWKRPLNLTVTTTLKCNAMCSYCYEIGVKQIDFETNLIDKIIDFISASGNLYGVNINWFGGEPLMNTELIDEVSKKITEKNIPFQSYMITNGSLVNDKIIDEKLELWHMHDMQITLDGTKKEYEKRKNYKNKSEGEYYKILYYISRIAEKGIYVHIRINIDKENFLNILELLEELEIIFGKYDNVVFYPAFLTGCHLKLSDREQIDMIKEMLIRLKNPKKLTTGTKLYSYPKICPCMKGDPYSFSIDVDGNIFDCEHQVGRNKYAIGSLKKGLFRKEIRYKRMTLRKECYECVFLPKCMGGCEANYIDGDSPCMIEKYIIMAYLEYLLK